MTLSFIFPLLPFCQVATPFILSTLGPRAKYSCSVFPSANATLGEAEEYTLAEYCVKAKLPIKGESGEGWEILDLGCGWGSLGLYLAEVSELHLLYRETQVMRVDDELMSTCTTLPEVP